MAALPAGDELGLVMGEPRAQRRYSDRLVLELPDGEAFAWVAQGREWARP